MPPGSLRAFPGSTPPNEANDVYKSLPVSELAEKAVLSCMLKSQREKISDAQETLNPEFFYIPAHRKIYETLSSLFDEFGKVDLITLTEELERKKTARGSRRAQHCGGPARRSADNCLF